MTDLLTPEESREDPEKKTGRGYDRRKKYCPPLGRPPQKIEGEPSYELSAQDTDAEFVTVPAGAATAQVLDTEILRFLREREKLDEKLAPEISENSGSEPHKTPEFMIDFRGDHLASLLATQTDDLVSLIDRRLLGARSEYKQEIERAKSAIIKEIQKLGRILR